MLMPILFFYWICYKSAFSVTNNCITLRVFILFLASKMWEPPIKKTTPVVCRIF